MHARGSDDEPAGGLEVEPREETRTGRQLRIDCEVVMLAAPAGLDRPRLWKRSVLGEQCSERLIATVSRVDVEHDERTACPHAHVRQRLRVPPHRDLFPETGVYLDGYLVADFADAFSRYLGPDKRYTATSAEKPLDSHADGALTRDLVADRENELSEPNSAAVADLSSFPEIPPDEVPLDGNEYAILDVEDERSDVECATHVEGELGELDPAEEAYRRGERLAIQEFGS